MRSIYLTSLSCFKAIFSFQENFFLFIFFFNDFLLKVTNSFSSTTSHSSVSGLVNYKFLKDNLKHTYYQIVVKGTVLITLQCYKYCKISNKIYIFIFCSGVQWAEQFAARIRGIADKALSTHSFRQVSIY